MTPKRGKPTKKPGDKSAKKPGDELSEKPAEEPVEEPAEEPVDDAEGGKTPDGANDPEAGGAPPPPGLDRKRLSVAEMERAAAAASASRRGRIPRAIATAAVSLAKGRKQMAGGVSSAREELRKMTG